MSPSSLAEDAALLRCLIDQPDAASELLTIRAYLTGARTHDADADLAADHAFTVEQISFLTLLEQPHQLDRLRATFEMFRNAYSFAYVTHHDAYWQEVARLRAEVTAAGPAAAAIERLNTLQALGPAVGEAAVTAYRHLVAQPDACSATDLANALIGRPTCPQCGLSLGDTPPGGEVAGVLADLRAALATQQTRLAGEAVRRILDRGGERLQQFVQIVQAADVAALTRMLDDDLVAFLQDLLVSPEVEVLDLLREIASAYPVDSVDQIDALVEALRSVLLKRLSQQRSSGS
jgi:hypothetical protein